MTQRRHRKLVEPDERGRISLKPLVRPGELFLAQRLPEGLIVLIPIKEKAGSRTVKVGGRNIPIPDVTAAAEVS